MSKAEQSVNIQSLIGKFVAIRFALILCALVTCCTANCFAQISPIPFDDPGDPLIIIVNVNIPTIPVPVPNYFLHPDDIGEILNAAINDVCALPDSELAKMLPPGASAGQVKKFLRTSVPTLRPAAMQGYMGNFSISYGDGDRRPAFPLVEERFEIRLQEQYPDRGYGVYRNEYGPEGNARRAAYNGRVFPCSEYAITQEAVRCGKPIPRTASGEILLPGATEAQGSMGTRNNSAPNPKFQGGDYIGGFGEKDPCPRCQKYMLTVDGVMEISQSFSCDNTPQFKTLELDIDIKPDTPYSDRSAAARRALDTHPDYNPFQYKPMTIRFAIGSSVGSMIVANCGRETLEDIGMTPASAVLVAETGVHMGASYLTAVATKGPMMGTWGATRACAVAGAPWLACSLTSTYVQMGTYDYYSGYQQNGVNLFSPTEAGWMSTGYGVGTFGVGASFILGGAAAAPFLFAGGALLILGVALYGVGRKCF